MSGRPKETRPARKRKAKEPPPPEPPPVEEDFDIDACEMRIGKTAREVLLDFMELTPEQMKINRVSLMNKADVALRCINTLEGSRQEITWRDELRRRPRKVSLKTLEKERADKEARLKAVLMRRQEVQVAQAEEALKELEHKKRLAEEEGVTDA